MCEHRHGLDAFGMHLTHYLWRGQWIATNDTIWDVMYAFIQKSGHIIWRKWWYTFTSKVSLQANFYMIWEDQVFVADVVVIDPMQETMAFSVISQPANGATKLNFITKIHKYWRLHEGHHFIPTTMEVHGAPECDMDHFIKDCARLFHDRWSKGHLSLSFYIQFFNQHA
jgi:hypothetical protein